MNELELLKCPCCGDLPNVYEWGHDYCVQCARYACNFPYTVMSGDTTSAIEGWNDLVNKYKGAQET